jgi:hypothetical protein
MNPIEDENKIARKLFDLEEIIEFQKLHKVEVLIQPHYQYHCFIDYKEGDGSYASGFTNLGTLIMGIKNYKKLKKTTFLMEANQLKATELRCGNLIHRYDKIVYTNIGILTKIQNGSVIYKPIPLTEDILVKLGFETPKGIISFNKNKLSIYLGGRTYYNSWAILEESPKYVHQLQNLFFSLTGEELTFKNY